MSDFKALLLPAVLVPLAAFSAADGAAAPFQVEEATLSSIHAAIQSGETTCKAVVQAYIDRAKAYNGMCTALVTPDGKPVKAAKGYVRAGSALKFPTQTVAASKIFPDLDQYKGPALDFGRMEKTMSDPSVVTQMGMRVGLPNAGQLNALETINIRGERSITCKGKFDAHPSTGPLPKDAPPECEKFRQQPDALEHAAELDAKYGRHPDLEAMPLYCATASFKDPYDTKDMRSTANDDVNFAMDAPPFDATIVARMRARGAIIYAKSTAAEFNGGPGDPGGDEKPKTVQINGGQQMNSWSGQPCNPYDTTRVPRGTSNGSGVSVSANLVTIGICEQTAASCQGPASRNGVALLLTTKGLTPDSGGIGNQFFLDRSGIHARTLTDAAKVLDAIKDPVNGYFDPHDPFTALPRALVSKTGYASSAVSDADLAKNPKPLKGMRIAILREHMVQRSPNHVAIVDQTNNEFKTILRDKLGAEIVETVTPDYPDDPDVPNLTYNFSDALSELLPRMMPEIFKRKNADGSLAFAVPGYDVTSIEYLMKLSRREAPLTAAVNITNFATFAGIPCFSPGCSDVRFDIDRYLIERGDSRIKTWKDWVANAKYQSEAGRAGAVNWANLKGHAEEGKSDRIARSYIARQALLKVMLENRIDAFVHAENTVPTPKILGPNVGVFSLDGITPFFQIPKIVVPAGFTDVEVSPIWALDSKGTGYTSVIPPGTGPTKMEHPMPIAMTFFSGQGEEPTLIKIGTAYESATHHRKPPPAFGPVEKR